MTTLPALFLGHGAPDLVISETPAKTFLESLAMNYPGVRAILAISAHWEARVNTVGSGATPPTIHDFGGFDPMLYTLSYPARTTPDLIKRVDALLDKADIPRAADPSRGYDHGVWIPLMIAYPAADIPVVQLSLRHGASAAENLLLGRALAPLRDEGVLIVGSGATVHNLRRIGYEGTPPPDFADAFNNWVIKGATSGDVAALARFPDGAPNAHLAHPTPEHLMPFYVALGAGGGRGSVIHQSFSWGSIAMTSFEFGEPLPTTA